MNLPEYLPDTNIFVRVLLQLLVRTKKLASLRRFIPVKYYRIYLSMWYTRHTKKPIDLSAPKTFNEKIQWLKIYDNSPLKSLLADKYAARAWVAEKVGAQYLVPLYGVWDSFDTIDFASLPQSFVLKANHGSGWNILVPDKNQLDMADAKKKIDSWLTTSYAFENGLELLYRDIKPQVLAEAYLFDEDLHDYKFFCSNGQVHFLWVDFDRYGEHKRDILDTDWNLLPDLYKHNNADERLPKPENLAEMVHVARTLCQGFYHVRVDLYNTGGKIYFGEMTFTTSGGKGHFLTKESNRRWGDLIRLPCDPQPE